MTRRKIICLRLVTTLTYKNFALPCRDLSAASAFEGRRILGQISNASKFCALLEYSEYTFSAIRKIHGAITPLMNGQCMCSLSSIRVDNVSWLILRMVNHN